MGNALAVPGALLDVERLLALAAQRLDVQLVLDVLQVVLLALLATAQCILKGAALAHNIPWHAHVSRDKAVSDGAYRRGECPNNAASSAHVPDLVLREDATALELVQLLELPLEQLLHRLGHSA